MQKSLLGTAALNLFLADLDAEYGECPQRKVLDGTFVYGASGGCTTGAGVTYSVG